MEPHGSSDLQNDLQNRDELSTLDDLFLSSIGTAGYAATINFTRKGAEMLATTFPEGWLEKYDKSKFIWVDPVLLASVMKEGNRRWSEVRLPDPFGVLRSAREFNLIFGATFTRFARSENYPCVLSVARSDRELNDKEMKALSDWFDQFVSKFDFTPKLTAKELEALQLLSLGLTITEASERSRISASAMKNRLSSCRAKLDARTNAEALLRAAHKRLL